MKKTLIFAAGFGLAASAHAARVTNLDTVAHAVQFESAGSIWQETVAPNRTAYFPRMDGIIGLKGGTPAKSSVTSDGLLHGIIGAERTSNIPAGPNDDFTIWPGGQMHLQRRQKAQMGN